MSLPISQLVFNKIFENFLTDYVKAYGDICQQVEKLLVPHYYKEVKDHPTAADRIMKMVQKDFMSKERRQLLRHKDPQLFLNKDIFKQTTLIRHLELRTLWQKTIVIDGKKVLYLKDEDREQLWMWLNKMWLIARSTLTLPKEVVETIERFALDKATRFHQSNMDIKNDDFKQMGQECKLIIRRVTPRHFEKILKWGRHMLLKEYTPVWELIPDKYQSYANNVKDLLNDEIAREVLMDAVQPVMVDIRASADSRGVLMSKRSGPGSVVHDQDEDNLDDEEEDKKELKDSLIDKDSSEEEEDDFYNENSGDMTVVSVSSSDNQPSLEDQQKVDYVMDLILGLLEQNGDSIRDLFKNPQKLMLLVMNQSKWSSMATRIRKDIRGFSNPVSSSSSLEGSTSTSATNLTKATTTSSPQSSGIIRAK
ncbi:MAG: hypothetical protein Sylvanvirus2_40 [Sylvanvirus sp.]|uniref:Uncharacterized protein n=1 Tax=Sylvanvirus sp. TaxID=2487774 RepID=A0A3G5AIX0_9VIRU|nr:MAG: hypothetical protein Sylvanvirus2_40 [Sylvanvirus sp.]